MTASVLLAQEWTVMQMAEYYIQDKTAELNKRVDDAFTELDTQRNRMSGLTRENSELKQEIIRLTDIVNSLRIFLGLLSMIAVGIWCIQLVL